MQQMSMYPWFIFVLGFLAVWRLTHLLLTEDGPFDILFKLRRFMANSFFGKLFACFYCLSLWISAPAALYIGNNWLERILLWLAMSAVAIFIECLHNKLVAVFIEEPMHVKEESDELLRK